MISIERCGLVYAGGKERGANFGASTHRLVWSSVGSTERWFGNIETRLFCLLKSSVLSTRPATTGRTGLRAPATGLQSMQSFVFHFLHTSTQRRGAGSWCSNLMSSPKWAGNPKQRGAIFGPLIGRWSRSVLNDDQRVVEFDRKPR